MCLSILQELCFFSRISIYKVEKAKPHFTRVKILEKNVYKSDEFTSPMFLFYGQLNFCNVVR